MLEGYASYGTSVAAGETLHVERVITTPESLSGYNIIWYCNAYKKDGITVYPAVICKNAQITACSDTTFEPYRAPIGKAIYLDAPLALERSITTPTPLPLPTGTNIISVSDDSGITSSGISITYSTKEKENV